MASIRFAAALAEAKGSGRVLLDLTESDPARCGLAWESEELEGILGRRRTVSPAVAISEAREAVAGYLAGHGASIAPARVVPVRSRDEALRLVLEAVCDRDGEVLVPVPHRRLLGSGSPVRSQPYRLTFEERWRIDLRSVQRAVSRGTRAIVVGNPADPTGAELSRQELEFLGRMCEARTLALVAEESFLDSALERVPSATGAARCLAVHVSGLGGICGLPQLDAAWVAVGGPETTAAPLVSRLATMLGDAGSRVTEGILLVPPLLGRREAFLSRLRARLARNRSALASASLREAPWTMQWGGGWWAVLQINPDQHEDELCLALLEEGVAAEPGYLAGFPHEGYLVLSLLAAPEVFDAALGRVEAQLRRPASHSARA